MSLAEKIKYVKSEKKAPLWTGPNGDGSNGGITQGLIGKFLCCPERLRVLVVEGLKPNDTFSHRMEYGNLWHVCEEHIDGDWPSALKTYSISLCKKYPTQQLEIDKWYQVCKVQFPVYVNFWKKHPDIKNRKPILQEYQFSVSYTLPSQRVVRLRGKFDSVDLIDGVSQNDDGTYLQENKTKGDIDELQLQRQLASGFDLQTMMYLISLQETINMGVDERISAVYNKPIRGVRYNVVRRPLSGGKGSIRQHVPSKSNPQGESPQQFCARLGELIVNAQGQEWGVGNNENYFFRRWKIRVSEADILRFKKESFDPILERMCDWWDYTTYGKDVVDFERSLPSVARGLHFRMPYGVYNPLMDGGETEIDEYINTGNKIGLKTTDVLYPELVECGSTG